jgi:two-component system chemotaxis response regulator CheY
VSARAAILCVDDEQAVLNQLSGQLSRRFGDSHVVECAESAEEALALIDELEDAGTEVELVLCDQVMPGMKGDKFLECVHRTRPDVMKVLLTGQAGLDAAVSALNRASLDRYIEKPWEPEDLELTVESLLTQYRLRKDLGRQNERLERRSRELRSLHQVGLALGATEDPGRVLEAVVEAARSLSRARAVAAVAQTSPRHAPIWSGLIASPLAPEAWKTIEASLTRWRAKRLAGGPEGVPEGVRVVPMQRADVLYGWILLVEAPEQDQDTADLVSILAGQAAAGLANLELLEERVESERLSTIGRMIGTIVHDFRNPMTALKGYAGLLEELPLPPERQKEFARLIVEEADRMGLMIEEILEFTRGSPKPLRKKRTTVEELAGKLERLMQPEFQARGIAFATELAYPGEIAVDADRLNRAILNIASNALDAMEPGGTFTFASRLSDGRVELSFRDTGRGIPEELRERIFEPFFTHGKPRGIGLGMSITRKIVEEHGGEIRVESRPGAGTTFTLRLPAEPA